MTDLDRFISESFDEQAYSGNDLMERLALGELPPVEREAALSHALAKFIVRQESSGRLRAASPILARIILQRRQGPLGGYGDCLAALVSADHARTRSLTDALEPQVPRLSAFRDAVELVCAVDGGGDTGLLGINWGDVKRVGGRLRAIEEAPPSWRDWATTLERWADVVLGKSPSKDDGRQRLDSLTVQASSRGVFLLLEFTLSRYVRRADTIKSPSDRVRRLLIVPERCSRRSRLGFAALTMHRLRKCCRPGPTTTPSSTAGRPSVTKDEGKLEMTALLVKSFPPFSLARKSNGAASGVGEPKRCLCETASPEACRSLAEPDGAH